MSASYKRRGLHLNIGSSNLRFPGFESLDREVWPGVRTVDFRLGLPYPDNSASVIVCSHCLEHVHPFFELPAVLQDIHRVLAPGGTLRVAVPDLAVLVKAYQARDAETLGATQGVLKEAIGYAFSELPAALQFSVIAFGNNSKSAVFDGHFACWDAESMKWRLELSGFTEVQVVDSKTSRDPELLACYQDIAAPEQCLIECTK